MTTTCWRRGCWISAIGLALGAVLLGGCIDDDLHAIEAGTVDDLATTSTIIDDPDGPLPIGAAAAKARGNTVAVLEVETDPDDAHALVEACAAPDAAEDVGVSLSFFALRLDDGSTVTPIEPRDAREPALRTHRLRSGTCSVGWLTFDLRGTAAARGRYVLFGSQTSAMIWDVSDAR